jgi:hypothetical protein
VQGVFTIILTELLDFKALGPLALVTHRGVIPALALGAHQERLFSHYTLLTQEFS